MEWSGELFYERVLCVYFPRKINTKIAPEWAQKQFVRRIHTECNFLHDINNPKWRLKRRSAYINVLIHKIIFRFYLLKYSLFFFKYTCTNIFHRRSLYTFYQPHVSLARFFVLLMTSESIFDDVTNVLHDATIVTREIEKRYVTPKTSVLFTAIFTAGRVRIRDTPRIRPWWQLIQYCGWWWLMWRKHHYD